VVEGQPIGGVEPLSHYRGLPDIQGIGLMERASIAGGLLAFVTLANMSDR